MPQFKSRFSAFLMRLHAVLTGTAREAMSIANEPVPLWVWLLWG